MSLRPFAASILLVGCVPDGGLTKHNNMPEATITSHTDGDAVDEGYVLTFRGTVSDTNHGAEDLVATWFVGAEALCAEAPVDATGETLCEAVLGPDDEEVVLEGRDPENATGTARVTLVVNPTGAPVAEIRSPVGGGRYYAGTPIGVEAEVSDPEDDAGALTIAWTDGAGAAVDLDTTPDGGRLEGELTLGEGVHQLVLTVTDTTGKVGTAELGFEVGPASSAPACAITSPLDGGTAEAGASVGLAALVSDPDLPATALVATWASDRDGALGGATVAADGTTTHPVDTLSFGTHVLTLTVTDDTGLTCTDDVRFSIGTPPDVTIAAPLDGALSNEGDVVSFLATVSDAGTAPDALVLTWESDLDGLLDGTPADASGLAGFDAAWLSPGAHVVTLTAVDGEGLYTEASVTLTVNGLPGAPTIFVEPGAPGTTDDLVAFIDAGAVDPEGDAVGYTWAWTRDGVTTAYTTDTVPADATTRGEVWEVVVTPSDGWGDGTPGVASVTIGNTAPALADATLSPDPAREGDTLTCTPGAASDADGDGVAATYAWRVNGLSVASTDPALGDSWWSVGDTVACVVTPTDGTIAGASVTSNTVTIANAPPTIASVSISPASATAADTLVCAAAGFSDPDGDADATTYAWTVNGVAAGAGNTLAGAFVGGDAVACTATPSDGAASGAALTDTLTIANTPPLLASVSLTPTTAYEASTLTCTPGTASDADGTTSFTYAYAWYVNGALIAPTTSTLTGSSFSRGDTVTCRATPHDGTGAGTGATSSTVTISNTAPVVSAVTLSPTLVYTNDTITASVSASDADGDSVAYTYAWYVDGALAGTSATLPGTSFAKGQAVYVRVTPTDGTTAGSASASSTVTIGNTAPSAPAVYIDPEDPEDGLDPLVCRIETAASDIDGDSVTYAFTWTRNGSAYTGDTDTSTTSTVPAAATSEDDVFVCRVNASDGSASSSTATDTVTVVGASYTIGYATPFASPATGYSGGGSTTYSLGQQITVSSAVDLYALGAGLRLANTTDSIRMALYTNSGGAPGTLVAYTTLTALSPYGAGENVEMEVVGAPVSLAAGTYWIMVNTTGGRVYFNYTTSGASANTIAYATLSPTVAFPTSFGTASTYTGQILGHYMVVR